MVPGTPRMLPTGVTVVTSHNSGWSVLLLLSFQTVVADAFGDDDDSSDRRSKSGH